MFHRPDVLTAFVAHVDRRLALHVTVIPHIEWSRAFFSVPVAILRYRSIDRSTSRPLLSQRPA